MSRVTWIQLNSQNSPKDLQFIHAILSYTGSETIRSIKSVVLYEEQKAQTMTRVHNENKA